MKWTERQTLRAKRRAGMARTARHQAGTPSRFASACFRGEKRHELPRLLKRLEVA